MKRGIIEIDQERCDGCGACADACHEGAIAMVDGKARLMRDDHCDGLGDCLPACPTGAISFVEREAAAYDEAAVSASRRRRQEEAPHGEAPHGGCPGSRLATLRRAEPTGVVTAAVPPSRLAQWPVQIKLVPASAPYFDGARLLIAADCILRV